MSISVLLTACTKQLTVDPRQSINFSSALNTVDGMTAALNSVYAGLKSTNLYGRDLLAVSDALADVGFANGKSGRLVGENRNQQGSHFVLWGTAYGLINEINLILDAIPKTNTSQANKDKWEGEAKFLRALMYFDLVKCYAYIPTATVPSQEKGGVPLRLIPTNSSTEAGGYKPSRASIAAVYAQIYLDLNDAIAKIPATSTNRAFATQGSARAILSRVALYNGDWATVITQSTSAISSTIGSISNAASYVAGWRASVHPESMFEVTFATAAENVGVNTSLQTSYTGLAALQSPAQSGGGFGDFVPNTIVLGGVGLSYASFATYPAPTSSFTSVAPDYGVTRGADVRALLYEWGTTLRGTRYVECTKFFGKNGIINLDNVPVIRKSELLLNRAEAYYKRNAAGDEALALADLNTFRANRGLPVVVFSGVALFNEIINQRFLEFAFEGLRFFDLKRLGMDIVKPQTGSTVLTLPFTDTRLLAGIPQGEIDGNPNMVQNPGY